MFINVSTHTVYNGLRSAIFGTLPLSSNIGLRDGRGRCSPVAPEGCDYFFPNNKFTTLNALIRFLFSSIAVRENFTHGLTQGQTRETPVIHILYDRCTKVIFFFVVFEYRVCTVNTVLL